MRVVTSVVLPFSRIGTETSRIVHIPVFRAVSIAEEGETCANRQRFSLRLFLQEVAKNTRRGKTFPICDGR